MINFKKGFHRIFIIFSFAVFMMLIMYFNEPANALNEVWIYPLCAFLSFCFYLFYYILLWLIAGFKEEQFNVNKGVVMVLILMNFVTGIIAVEREITVLKLKKEKQKLENEYSLYRSRREGNYSGWTLEEIRDLFNGK